MKKFALLVLLFSFTYGFSQKYPEERLELLKELNVNIENLNIKDRKTQLKLNEIISLDKRRKSNKTLALITTGLSVASFVTGGLILSDNEEKETLTNIVGGTIIASGFVYGGISVPLWMHNSKRKKERDELIEEINNQNPIK